MKLAGKVAVVTGGARGLGLAVVRRLLAEGAHVLSVDRSIPQDGVPPGDPAVFHTLVADIAVEAQARAAPAVAHEHFGRLDILVLNAGRHSTEPVTELTAAEFDATFATNVRGAALMLAAAAPLIEPGGAIVTVGSTATRSVQVGELSYRASKLALRGLTESAAIELAGRGIRANLVTPGAIDTGFSGIDATWRKRVCGEIPLGREALPQEIAATIVFAASPVAAYMTGAELLVDGGLSMRPLRVSG